MGRGEGVCVCASVSQCEFVFQMMWCVCMYVCVHVCVGLFVYFLSMSVFRPSVWNSNDAYYQKFIIILLMFVLGHTQKPKMIT